MKQFLLAGACILNAAFAVHHNPANFPVIHNIADTVPSTDPCASYVYVNDAKSFPADPVYTDEEQSIFWVSPTVAPGESALIKGAFSNGAKSVRLTYHPANLKDGRDAVTDGQDAVTLNATLIGSSGLTFKIPSNFPKGVYAFDINHSPRLTGRINLPKIYWANGYGRQITPGDVLPGDSLIVAGSDFPLRGILHITLNNQTTPVPYTTTSADEIQVRIPPSIKPGNGQIIISPNENIDASASDPFNIQFRSATPDDQLAIQTVNCPGLTGDGQTDNSASLINCLEKNRPRHNMVYIKIPGGVFKFSLPITLLPYQYLVGNGPNATILKGLAGDHSIPDIWVKGSHHFGLMNICISAGIGKILVANYSDIVRFNPDNDTTGHIYIYNSILQCEAQNPLSKTSAILQIGGPDIQVINTIIDNTRKRSSQNIGMYAIPTGGALFDNLRIRLGDWGWGVSINSCRNVLFENSGISGEASTPGASNGISLASDKFQGSSDGILIRNNTFRNFVTSDKEAITTDGTNGSYLGYVQSSTPGQVILRDLPNWNHIGPFSDKKFMITITAGRGVGQFRYVAAIDGKKISLTEPWSVPPDQHSVVTITLKHRYIDINQNKFDNIGAVQFYGGVFDSFIDDNEMTGSQGISLCSPVYACGSLPIQNIDIQSNSILGNRGADTAGTNGFYIRSNYNGAISGVAIKNNQMAAGRRLKFTPGGIPRMQAFLLENNSGGDFSRLNTLPGKGMMIIAR